jgi:hypothetical protein
MGQSSSVFNRYYLSKFVSNTVQCIFFGLPQDWEFEKYTKRISRKVDARIPTQLTEDDRTRLSYENQELLHLSAIREAIKNQSDGHDVTLCPVNLFHTVEKVLKKLPLSKLETCEGK